MAEMCALFNDLSAYPTVNGLRTEHFTEGS
jgi:hypothetical protein